VGKQMDREPAELDHFRVVLQAYMAKKGLRSTDQRRSSSTPSSMPTTT